jgi:RNA polymerase sigma factor (sigma-70 family)
VNADALLAEAEPIVRHQVHRFAAAAGAKHLELDLRQHARIALWRAAAEAPAEDLHRVKWATVVIRRGAVDGLRTMLGRQGSAQAEAERGLVELASDDQAQPCDAASLLTVKRLIERIAALPARQQRLVEAFVEGMTGPELASEWGVTRSRVCQEAAELRAWLTSRL